VPPYDAVSDVIIAIASATAISEMSAATHKRKSYTIKLKLEICEYVHTQKNLMWQVGDVLIEAGSLIQAG